MFRILLVQAPFADINRPSIGLALLKAGLMRRGLPCDVEYLNLKFADRIGVDTYQRIDRFDSGPQLGEWLFSECLFGKALPDAQRYYEDVLRPAMREPFDDDATFGRMLQDDEMVEGFRALQRRAAEFLEECVRNYDWASYDLVGFTSTFQQNTAALALARLVKQAHPRLLVAFGGANCEGEMGLALHRLFPFIDIVCSGEGDLAFVNYAEALATGGCPENSDGIISRSVDQKAPQAAMTSPVRDMNALPLPDYSDFFAQHETLGIPNKDVVLPVESSRGCWWGQKAHCTFCGLNGGGMAFRVKSPDRFLDEVKWLVDRHAVHSLTAVDNIIDMRYFQSVLPALAELRPPLRFFYETKSNLQRQQVRLLREAGIIHIQPGIESLSTAVLSLMRKGVQAYQNVRLLRWCAEYVVHPSWNVLGGFPGEDPDEYAKQADVMRRLTHLVPPVYVGPVRLDRFSPLFDRSQNFEIRNVQPARAYRYIYPFSGDDLAQLAYFFEFEYGDERQPLRYLQRVRDTVNEWKRADAFDSLTFLDDGTVMTIVDRRRGGAPARYEVSGLEREICLACDEGLSLTTLVRALHDRGLAVHGEAVEHCLESLLQRDLMLFIDSRYLFLPVSGNFRVEKLAMHLKEQSQPPPELRAAFQRVFNAHADGFADHLARYLA